MKLTITLKLLPTDEQRKVLLGMMRRFNAAANYAAIAGFAAKEYTTPSLHRLCYYPVRETFGLSARMATRAIGKAVECFSRDRKVCPSFGDKSAMVFDYKTIRFASLTSVNMQVDGGRIDVGITYGQFQFERLHLLKGQIDLVLRGNDFYLVCPIDCATPEASDASAFIGVDLGVTNIATTSDASIVAGEKIEAVRSKRLVVRRSLSHKMGYRHKRQTRRNARKALRRIGNKEARFRRHANHVISKTLVAIAKGTKRGIALETLKGIRDRIQFRKKQRARVGGWSFGQLREFIEYKAKLAGVPVVLVNPRNTSRKCSQCGHCEKANRQSQAEFHCRSCGFTAHADHNAALNISAAGAAVNRPEVSERQREILAV